MRNIVYLDVDIKLTETLPIPLLTQNDSIVLSLALFDNGLPMDLSSITAASLAHKRADGQVVVTQGTVKGANVADFPIGGTEMAVVSLVEAAAQLYSGEDRVTSIHFNYRVIEDPTGKGFIPSEDEKTLIEIVLGEGPKVIADAKEATQNANAAADRANTAAESIDQALTDVRQATEEAKQATTETLDAIAGAEQATTDAHQATTDANQATADAIAATTSANAASDKANQAADKATQAADAIEGWGNTTVWDPAASYVPKNTVTFNGSTWQALQPNTGTQPEEGSVWICLARKGVDGTGSVSSVNGIFPEENGNVVLPIPNATSIPEKVVTDLISAYPEGITSFAVSNANVQSWLTLVGETDTTAKIVVTTTNTPNTGGKSQRIEGYVAFSLAFSYVRSYQTGLGAKWWAPVKVFPVSGGADIMAKAIPYALETTIEAQKSWELPEGAYTGAESDTLVVFHNGYYLSPLSWNVTKQTSPDKMLLNIPDNPISEISENNVRILVWKNVPVGVGTFDGSAIIPGTVTMTELGQDVKDQLGGGSSAGVVISPIPFDEYPSNYPIGYSIFDVPTVDVGDWLSVFGISQIDATPYTKLRIYTDRTSGDKAVQQLVVVDDNSKLRYIVQRTSIGSVDTLFEDPVIVYGIPGVEIVNDFSGGTNKAASAETVKTLNTNQGQHADKIATDTDLGHIKGSDTVTIDPDGTAHAKQVEIVNDLITGGVAKAASAETVKLLKTELDNVVAAPAYGVEVINENHAIRRFPAFNGWQNNTLPELLYAIFDTNLENVEGEFRIRASVPRDANGESGQGEHQATVRRLSSTNVTTSDYGLFKASDEFAKQIYLGSSIALTTAEPANGRLAYSIVKILKSKPLYVEIEMFTSNGKAKEVLESIILQLRPNAYNNPWTLPPQKSSFEKAKYALIEGYTPITVTVSPSGNDLTGKWNDVNLPFKTIQGAVDSLPKYSNPTMVVSILAGTYDEIVALNGFTGAGTLTIKGGTSLSDANNFKVRGLYITGCSMRIDVSSLHFNNAGTPGVAVKQSQWVVVSNCNLDAGATGQNGITVDASTVYVVNTNISNRGVAIQANYGAIVYATGNSGSGNSLGLVANTASTIGKYGTQAGATTAESTSFGGQIRA